MLIYDKIARYMDSCPDIAKVSLGKEKCRIINKGFNDMMAAGYSYGVVKLTLSLLTEFSDIYGNYISQKDNPHLVDVYNYYIPRLEKDDIYLLYIRDVHGSLIAGGICAYKIMNGKRTFMLSFRAKSGDTVFQKLHMGYYIEYLFFQQGLFLSVEQFSRGRDTNGYGFLGSGIGVGTHKLQLHFLPYMSNTAKEIYVDETQISCNSLFITQVNAERRLTHAVLYLKEEDKQAQKYIDLVHILNKRGFSVDVRSCI